MKTQIPQLTLIVCLMLGAGCVGYAGPDFSQRKTIVDLSPAELREYGDTNTLLAAYGNFRRRLHAQGKVNTHNLRQELVRRNLFTQDQWARIDKKEMQIGDSPMLLRASWGSPRRINTRVARNGRRQQWVYGSPPFTSYVHIVDGAITSLHKFGS